jgi:hypothetical protein
MLVEKVQDTAMDGLPVGTIMIWRSEWEGFPRIAHEALLTTATDIAYSSSPPGVDRLARATTLRAPD